MSRQQPIDASRDSFDSPGDVAYSAAIFVAISAVYSKLSKFEFRMVWCKGQWYLLLECFCEGIRRGITTDYITPPKMSMRRSENGKLSMRRSENGANFKSLKLWPDCRYRGENSGAIFYATRGIA